jgi:hypothetical protein
MAAHLVVWTALGALTHTKEREKPNFLIIFVDDMGIDQIQVQSRADTTHSSSCFQFALQLLCIAPFGLMLYCGRLAALQRQPRPARTYACDALCTIILSVCSFCAAIASLCDHPHRTIGGLFTRSTCVANSVCYAVHACMPAFLRRHAPHSASSLLHAHTHTPNTHTGTRCLPDWCSVHHVAIGLYRKSSAA